MLYIYINPGPPKERGLALLFGCAFLLFEYGQRIGRMGDTTQARMPSPPGGFGQRNYLNLTQLNGKVFFRSPRSMRGEWMRSNSRP